MIKKLFLGITTTVMLGSAAVGFANTATVSSNSGIYLRGQLGYDFFSYTNSVSQLGYSYFSSTNSGGIAGRVSAGYDFNKYFALESGYSLWSYDGIFSRSPLSIIDFMAKATLPINQFFVFAEGGGTYSDVFGFEPKLGAGVGYNFNSHIGVDVSYDHIFTPNHQWTNPSSLNTVMGGFTYKF